MIQRQRSNINNPNNFFQFTVIFFFEKPVLTLENVSDKMPYPKQLATLLGFDF